jgi:hypothetical protein
MNYSELSSAIQTYTENNFPTITLADSSTVSSTTQINRFIQQAEQRIYNSVQFPSLRKNVTGTVTVNNKYLSAPEDFLAPYSLAVYTSALGTTTYTAGSSFVSASLATGLLIFNGASAALLTQISQIVNGNAVVVNGTAYVAASHGVNGITLTTPETVFDPITTVALTTTTEGEYTFLLNKDVNFMREAYPRPTDTGTPKYYALFGPTTTAGPPPLPTTELSFILGPTPDTTYSVELHYYYYPESITTAVNTWLGDNFDTVLLYGSLVEAYTFQKGEADLLALYDTKYKEALALAKRLGDGMERQDAYRSGQYRQAVT